MTQYEYIHTTCDKPRTNERREKKTNITNNTQLTLMIRVKAMSEREWYLVALHWHVKHNTVTSGYLQVVC